MLAGINDDLTFEGRLRATLRGLSDEDASAIAARIFELRYRVQEQLVGPPGGSRR